MYPLLTKVLGSMTVPAMMGKSFFRHPPTTLLGIDLLDDRFVLMASGLAL